MSESNKHNPSNLDATSSSSLLSAYAAFLRATSNTGQQQQPQQPDHERSSQSQSGLSIPPPPSAPPPSIDPILNIKISKSIINFDNVKIPRRVTEGRGPLFATRPELQDWIQNKMMTYDDDAVVKAAEEAELLQQQQSKRTVIVDKRIDMRHDRLGPRSSSQKPSSSLSSSSSSRHKNSTATTTTTATDPRLRRARAASSLNDKFERYSSEESPVMPSPRSRSTRRSTKSPHSSSDSMDAEEDEGLQIRPPRPHKRRRQFDHDDEDGGGRGPPRGLPSSILHVTWLGDEGLPPLSGSNDAQLTQVIFNYFNNMVKTAELLSVERLQNRPFYTWLIYPSPKHAQLAIKFIQRCVEKEKKFHFKDDGTQYRFAYKVNFSWKKFWNPHRHAQGPHGRSRASSQ